MIKLISWNVNGLRAAVGKGFLDFFHESDADIFCVQETKLQEGQIELDIPVIMITGIMRTKRDIRGQLFSPGKNPYL